MADAYGAGRTVVIVAGARTPFLKARGVPGPFRASDLAVAAGQALLGRLGLPAQALDEVIFGCILPGPDEANLARLVALRLGCGKAVPAWTVQRNCGSGLQAIDSAAMAIAHGRAELVLAGGTEAMSHAPVLCNDQMVRLLADLAKAGTTWRKLGVLARMRPAHLAAVPSLARLLRDPLTGQTMGQTAERLAERFGITRERMDAYALESHRRLARAQDEDRLEELVPLDGPGGVCRTRDEGLRRDADLAALARLKPAFEPQAGRVTAGNSAQVTDGAACLLLASLEAAQRHGLPILARIVDCHWAGLEPSQMGLGPVHAMAPILRRQGLGTEDIAYWEINEAFAAQVLACLEAWSDAAYVRTELGLEAPFAAIDPQRLNVDGGGVALGHPVGCSGARIVLHLAQVLKRNGARRGMASLCIGGGQGGAMLLEAGSP
jgi:acetyl-CoA C-acetyltransferase